VSRNGGVREWRKTVDTVRHVWGVRTFELTGESDIAQARSALASRWLSETTTGVGGEWSLWLDDDIVVAHGDLSDFIYRSIDSSRDIVAGLYAGKSPASGLVTSRFLSSPVHVGKIGGLVDIAACGFGCVLVRRTAFERVAQSMPLVRYSRSEWGDVYGRPYFLGMVVRDQEDPDGPGIHLGEDFAFCYRARAAGCRIAADTQLRVGHQGEYIYYLEDVNWTVKREESLSLHVKGVLNDTPAMYGEQMRAESGPVEERSEACAVTDAQIVHAIHVWPDGWPS
jgi:hypothetical protein